MTNINNGENKGRYLKTLERTKELKKERRVFYKSMMLNQDELHERQNIIQHCDDTQKINKQTNK